MSGRKKARARKPAKAKAARKDEVYVVVTITGDAGETQTAGLVTPWMRDRLGRAAAELESRVPGIDCFVDSSRELASGVRLFNILTKTDHRNLVSKRGAAV